MKWMLVDKNSQDDIEYLGLLHVGERSVHFEVAFQLHSTRFHRLLSDSMHSIEIFENHS